MWPFSSSIIFGPALILVGSGSLNLKSSFYWSRHLRIFLGEGDLGDTPTMTAQAGLGVGNGYTSGKQSPVSGSYLRVAAAMPLPWPSGPHVAG